MCAHCVCLARDHACSQVREALDAPFEYWVDATPPATLYFIPPNSTTGPLFAWVSNATASAEPLLSVSDTSHLSIVDITVSFTRGNAVSISNSHDITLLNVSVIGVGGSAISISESNSTTVAGASVSHSGGAGIGSYGGGSRKSLVSSGVVVVDSTVVHVGRRCLSYNGGITLDSIGAVAAFNAISGAPHIGTNVATNDGLFEYNVVTDTVLASCDMGGFYSGAGDWSVWNTTIRYSAFYRNGYSGVGCNQQSGNDLGDIYFDEKQSGLAIYGNVHWAPNPPHVFSYLSKARKTYSHIINGGRQALVSNSIIVDANISYFNSEDGVGGDYYHACAPNGTYISGMRAMSWNTGVYAARYPALAALQAACDSGPAACAVDATCPAAPYGCTVSDMVVVNVTQPVFLGENSSVFDPANFNISGQWAGLDPGFEAGSLAAARASLNFQLAADSPVYAALPGFERIPTECMGPYACPNLSVPYPRAASLRAELELLL